MVNYVFLMDHLARHSEVIQGDFEQIESLRSCLGILLEHTRVEY